MEQRIGPTSPPVHAAGTDPAAIPGLTTPSAPEPDAAAPEPRAAVKGPEEPEAATDAAPDAAADEPAAGEPEDVKAEDVKADDRKAADGDAKDADADASDAKDDAAKDDAAEDAKAADDEAADDEAADGEPAPDGPAFQVSDRRAAIAADHTGITFRLDTEAAEFSWDEIRAVAIDTPRFGRRFAVTVYTGPRRWFENDVEAQSKSLLKEWTAQLDAVLDRYFEDGGEKDDSAEDSEDAKDSNDSKDAKSDSADSDDAATEKTEKSEA